MKRIKLLLLALSCSAAGLQAAPDIPFERVERTSPMKIGKRPRVTPHTLIFARIQPYDLYGNYTYEWIDRPLFLNREWRDAPDGKLRGFERDIEIVKTYGIEGFTMLGNAYANHWRNNVRIVEQLKPEGFKLMGGLAWSESTPYRRYLDNIRLSLDSPYIERINGKVPFFSYASMPPDKIREIREKLAGDGCGDILLFDDIWLNVFAQYNADGKLNDALKAEMKKNVQNKLDVADGLILSNYHMYRDPKGEYTLKKQFYYDLDEKEIAPLMEDIYNEKRNQGKMLGFNIRHGYIGHMSGTNEAELGTEQLRDALDTALLMNPDIISLVEWNEANENTSFQPTVCNSLSLQRIIKFYAHKLKNLPPEPNPGDDPDIPNLIVSTRQTLKLGEKYRIELLNVPDSEEPSAYQVQLTLKDENGKTVKVFRPDQFRVNQLTAVTYTIPSEKLAQYRAVIPELTITGPKGEKIVFDQLQYTRLDPSVCWNFKDIRQPLRDLLKPRATAFAAVPRQGNYHLTGSLACDEALASLEVLNNELEIFALDRLDTFKSKENHLFRIKFFTKKNGKAPKSEIKVEGADEIIFQPWGRPYSGFGKWRQDGNRIEGEWIYWNNGSAMLLSVPQKAKDAVISFRIDGLGDFSYKIADLIKNGKNGFDLGNQTVLRIDCWNILGDHPVSLNRNDGRFDVVLPSDFDFQCFQLRAITTTGKIYRSKPVFTDTASGKSENLNVFSATERKAVTVQVPESLIRKINYRFSPDNGIVLVNPAAGIWDGQLGGGFQYLYPMRYGDLPENAMNTAPLWRESGGHWRLEFDGVGNYLVFPPETLPAGGFTLEFECRTDSVDNQALFLHNSWRQGSLAIYIVNGKLRASFYSMGRNYAGFFHELPVSLDFPAGRKVKVKVSYNLKEMVFTVDGRTQKIPFALRAYKTTASVFGGLSSTTSVAGDLQLNFFKGELYSLKIRHNAEQ